MYSKEPTTKLSTLVNLLLCWRQLLVPYYTFLVNTVNFAKYFRNASFSCGANALLVNCIFMLGNKLIP